MGDAEGYGGISLQRSRTTEDLSFNASISLKRREHCLCPLCISDWRIHEESGGSLTAHVYRQFLPSSILSGVIGRQRTVVNQS